MNGQNAESKGRIGTEWWGKRPLSDRMISRNSKTNKFFKRLLHKIERTEGIKDIENQLIEPDRDEDIWFELNIWD